MNSKRRDRRQRRLDVKQALHQDVVSESPGSHASSPVTNIRPLRNSLSSVTPISSVSGGSSQEDSPPSNSSSSSPIAKFGSRQLSPLQQANGAKVFALADRAEKSKETLSSQAAKRDTASSAPKRSRRSVEAQPSPSEGKSKSSSSSSARLQSLPSPLPSPRQPAKPSLVTSISLYTLRLMILGVGIGVITGTFLHHWNPTQRLSTVTSDSKDNAANQAQRSSITAQFPPVRLTQPIAPLTNKVRALVSGIPDLTPVVMVIDAETGAYVDIDSTLGVPAASTIKVPILVAFFQDVDAGKLRLDEGLTMRPDLVATGSGEMQYQPAGTKFTAWETAANMIITSDNTATNMLIDRLGGLEALTQRFKAWGLTSTALRNQLPDLSGTNTTSARDLADLLLQINQGGLVSPQSRDRIFSIMERTRNNTLLPQGIGPEADIAHKTGDIGTLVGDVGIVDMPNGKRYVIAVLVKRPYNDGRANDLISRISQTVYDHLNQPWEIVTSTTKSLVQPKGDAQTSGSPSPSPANAQ